MRMSWKLGRVAGIDLYLHPTFLLILALAGADGGGLTAMALLAAVFGCVLLHELGHALTARLFGVQTEDITLYPIGGVARLQRMPRSPGAELLITLAGPAVNVVIAAGLFAALALATALDPLSGGSFVAAFVARLMWVNVGLAVFNLIPAFPMDGGRILRALLAGPLGRLRATEIAAGVGRVLAIVFGIWALSNFLLWQVLLAAFIFFAAGAELNNVADEERRRRPAPNSGWGSGVWTAPPGYRWVSVGQGAWQLVPIVVPTYDRSQHSSWR